MIYIHGEEKYKRPGKMIKMIKSENDEIENEPYSFCKGCKEFIPDKWLIKIGDWFACYVCKEKIK